jgi:hypothetical protein
VKFVVENSFKAKTSQGEMTLEPGQIITLPRDLAVTLLNQGRVSPVGRVAIKIFSEMLNEELWIVADERNMDALKAEQVVDIAIYTANEIRELKGKYQEQLKTIHEAKKVFGEKVEDIEPRGKEDNNV